MTSKYFRRALLSLPMLLIACAHTPSANDVPAGATFTTKILDDDTKLFVYAQRFGRRADGGDDTMGDMPGRGGFGGGSARSAPSPQAMQRGVQAMLAQNRYCRDGFVVLEQYEEHGSYVVRGECRDAATGDDRSKFSQRH